MDFFSDWKPSGKQYDNQVYTNWWRYHKNHNTNPNYWNMSYIGLIINDMRTIKPVWYFDIAGQNLDPLNKIYKALYNTDIRSYFHSFTELEVGKAFVDDFINKYDKLKAFI